MTRTNRSGLRADGRRSADRKRGTSTPPLLSVASAAPYWRPPVTISPDLASTSTPSIGSVQESRQPLYEESRSSLRPAMASPSRSATSDCDHARTQTASRHELLGADGKPVIGSGDTFGPSGRHSRVLMDKPTELIFLDSLGWQTSLDVESSAPVDCPPMPPVTAEIETADTGDLVDPGDAGEATGELPKQQAGTGSGSKVEAHGRLRLRPMS